MSGRWKVVQWLTPVLAASKDHAASYPQHWRAACLTRRCQKGLEQVRARKVSMCGVSSWWSPAQRRAEQLTRPAALRNGQCVLGLLLVDAGRSLAATYGARQTRSWSFRANL
jgi:hypothetical protein